MTPLLAEVRRELAELLRSLAREHEASCCSRELLPESHIAVHVRAAIILYDLAADLRRRAGGSR